MNRISWILIFLGGLLFSLITLWGIAGMAGDKKLIFQDEKNHIFVYETGIMASKKKRCLTFANPEKYDNGSQEGCVLLKRPEFLVFDYAKFLMATLFFKPDPKKILMIGLGIGTVSNALAELVPEAEISVVEIDENVINTTKNYFSFQKESGAKVYIQDGYDFVQQAAKNGQKYDIIIMDAFSEDYIPRQFLTSSFFEAIKSLLNSDGVFGMNTYTYSPYSKLEADLITKTFGKFYYLASNNKVIIASKTSPPSMAQLQKNASSFENDLSKIGVDTNLLLQGIK